MHNRFFKRIMSMMLVLAMVLSFVSTTVFANTEGEEQTGTTPVAVEDFVVVDEPATETTVLVETTDIAEPAVSAPETKAPETKAATATSGTTGSCTWTLDGTVLTISGNGPMDESAYDTGPWGRKITEVIIEDGVTSIGKYAFYLCTQLTAVTIPDSVTNIGTKAFYKCTSLVEITIPAGVTVIGNQAFFDCSKLTAFHVDPDNAVYSNDSRGSLMNKEQTVLIHVPRGITGDYSVPESVTTIGKYAFYDCEMLMSITMGSNVTTISDYAFWYCDGITGFEIGSGVTTVGQKAFYYCRSLTSITIPEGVVRIGERAFDTCSALTSVSIPASVTEIGEAPFENCDNLIEILVDQNNVSYCSDDQGVLYNKNKTILIQAPQGLSGDYNIPQGVTEICSYAFDGCGLMTAMTIPDSVTRIGSYAFSACGGLNTVTIPGSSTILEHHAFYGCRNLMTVTVQGCITEFENYAFANCPKLTSVSIGTGTTQIGYGVFSSCSSLQTVAIPDTVTKIREYAFDQSGDVTIYYDGDATQWEQIDKVNGWDTGCTYTVTYLANFTVFYTTETGHVFPVAYEPDLKVEPGSSFNGADLNMQAMTVEVVSGPAAVREDDNMTVEVDYGATGTIVVALFCKGLRVGTLSFLVEDGDGGLFAAGYGTEERPFLIEDASQFSNIRKKPDCYFMLINHISLGSIEPIPYLQGSLDGCGYTISDWSGTQKSGDAQLGLFRMIKSGGEISNLRITNFSISNSNPDVSGALVAGMLCGENSGTISDVKVTFCSLSVDVGDISKGATSQIYAGMLCGSNYGSIIRCEAYGAASSRNVVKAVATANKSHTAQVFAGALVGYSYGGEITDCQSYYTNIEARATTQGGKILWWCNGHGTSIVRIGGVVGHSYSTTFTRVLGYSNNNLISTSNHDGCGCSGESYAGSIVGYSTTISLNSCYAERSTSSNVVGNSTSYNSNKADFVGYTALNKLPGFIDNGWVAVGSSEFSLARISQIEFHMQNYECEQGRPLNLNGAYITAYMEKASDGLSNEIRGAEAYTAKRVITGGYVINGYNADKNGGQQIEISYGPKSCYEFVYLVGHVHQWVTQATCKVGAICESCGFEDTTKLLPHSYVKSVTKPTCKGGGYTTNTCSVCGFYEITDAVPALEHKLDFRRVCEYCGIQFDVLRDFTVYVCDAESAAPIAGAMVNLGGSKVLTDASGAARYQIGNNNQRRLTIEAAGYPKLSNEYFVPGEMPNTYIYLESSDTGIYEAWCNGDNVLLIESQINVRAPSKVAKIVVKGRAKSNILKYEIVQDDMVLATSADGVFQIKNPHFLLDTPVFVRMHTDAQDGHNMFRRELNISVIGFSFDAKLDDLIPHLGGANFHFDETSPSLFQGVEFPLLKEMLPDDHTFTIKTDNNKLIITYGLEKDYLDKDTDDKTPRELFKDILKKFKEQNDPNFWPKGKKKSEFTFTFALIIEVGSDGNIKSTYGEIYIGYEFSHTWGKTFVVWIVPIYVGTKFKVGGNLKLTELGYNFEESKFLIPDAEIDLYLELSVYGGIGCSLVSAGVYGTGGGEIIIGWKDLQNYFKYRVYGEIGLYARIDPIFWEAIEYKLPLLSDEFYGPNGQVRTKKAILTPENYDVAPRDYLETRSAWKTTSTYAKRGDTSGVLQTSSYTAIKPRIVQSGDTVMMLFMDDDGSAGYNYQHLYYSVLDPATNSWKTPVRVDDSQFADIDYDVYSDDSGIYLAYSKIPEITEENRSDHLALLSGVEIYTARYDGSAFVDHTNVSNNAYYDTQPQIFKNAVVWVSNNTNDTLGENSNNTLMLSRITQSGWGMPVVLHENGSTVASIDLGQLGGKTFVSVIRDGDCDLSTDDRQLQLIDMAGTVIAVPTTDYTSEGVRFETVDGNKVLQWACAGNVWQLDAAEAAPIALFAEENNAINDSFKYQQLGEGRGVIVFAQNAMDGTSAGSSLYGVYCVNGQWGEAVAITEHAEGMYVDAFDACYYKDKILLAYINTEAAIGDETIDRTCNFISSTVELKNDLVVGDASVMGTELFEDTEIEIRVPITNGSWQKLQNTTVQVQSATGTVVYECNVKLEEAIASGESDRVAFKLPKACLTAGVQYSVWVMSADWTDSDMSNNTALLTLWYADFEVVAKQFVQDTGIQIQYSVVNNGNIEGSGKVVVYDDKNTDGSFTGQPKLYEQDITVGVSRNVSAIIPPLSNLKDNTVYVVVEPITAEMYLFDNEQAVSVAEAKRTTTDDITGTAQAIPNPVFAEPYVIYDRYAGGDVTAPATENGWIFTSVDGLDSYSYSGSTLTIPESYLKNADLGYHYYTLHYTMGDKTTEAMLILEIRDHAPLSVENVIVEYDGAPVELTDLSYETPSSGAVSTRYKSGGSWLDGLPTNAGEYTVELILAAEEEGFYTAAKKQFTLTVTRAVRSISAPQKVNHSKSGVTFTGAVVDKASTDGKISYGYSTKADPNTVTSWTDEGFIPPSSAETTYYLFARVTGSSNYTDSYSAAYITSGVDLVIYGDVNGDGKVNGTDVSLLRRYIAGGYDVQINLAVADVDQNGRINGADVSLIRRFIAGGWGVEFPDVD